MYMIFYAIDTVKLTIFLFDYTGNILIKLFAICFGDSWLPVLRAENDLVENLAITAHDICFAGKIFSKSKRYFVIMLAVNHIQPLRGCLT